MLERFKKVTRDVWPEDVDRVNTLYTRYVNAAATVERKSDRNPSDVRALRTVAGLFDRLVELKMPIKDDSSTVSIEVRLTREQEAVLEESRQLTPTQMDAIWAEEQQRARASRDSRPEDMI